MTCGRWPPVESVPRRALGLIAEWARLHREELEANWERARREEPLEPINRFRSIGYVDQLVDVLAVEVVGGFRLRLTFEDGTVGEVDFAARAWRGVFEPLRNPAYFARVRVDPDAGTIKWPNGVDMAPEHLYEQARRNPVDHLSETG